MLPALAFLCVGVPLAALLDEVGFFDAVASSIAVRWPAVPVGALWLLAAATTAVLNLDTTVVLLTPLYVRLARRAGVDPLPLAAVPLLLAAFASSVLPVSNLTTLIAADRVGLSVGDVLTHLAPVSFVACTVGWLAYRRIHPRRLPTLATAVDPLAGRDAVRARRVGGTAVAVLLAGFVLGPSVGVAPWMVALAVDLALVVVTRTWPWRDVPILTAAGVALLAAVTATVVPATRLGPALSHDEPLALAGLVLGATAAANVVNNLPALLVALDATTAAGGSMSWGLWAWLAGVNTGAVLLPIGALANILWWRILRDEDIELSWRRYVRLVLPVALPALLAGAATMAVVRVAFG